MSENESVEETGPAICIDNGSGMVKAGIAGEQNPKLVFPSIIGKTKPKAKKEQPELKDFYVGSEVASLMEQLIVKHPIDAGVVNDWDLMEKMWEYTFQQLGVEPEDKKVLLTEPPHNPKENKENMAEIMFEKFMVGSLHVGMQAVMSLYAVGKTTGVVLDIGDGVAHTVPVSEGFIIPNNIKRLDLAGRDLTGYLAVLLSQRELNFTTGAEMRTVSKIKEETSYVALDYEKELEKEPEELSKEFELPDKTKIKVQQERFKCLEPLFKPFLLELEGSGVPHILTETVMKCDIDLRKELFGNIVLSGGTCSAFGFKERMKKELQKLVTTMKINIVDKVNEKYAVWQGSSVVAELPNFDGWISIDDFLEHGASCIHGLKKEDDE